MMPVMDRKRIVGESSGIVIFRIFCHSLAPSMSAASISDFGTFSRPAMNITICSRGPARC